MDIAIHAPPLSADGDFTDAVPHPLTLRRCTFLTNTATGHSLSDGCGGGIYSGTVRIAFCTLHANQAKLPGCVWILNGATATISKITRISSTYSGIRCVSRGFEEQTEGNKVRSNPYVVCRDVTGQCWVSTVWVACHRTWSNLPVPCLHSDPNFLDCAPG